MNYDTSSVAPSIIDDNSENVNEIVHLNIIQK
jgi:hypothetical protein